MKDVPNAVVASLVRHLPLLIACVDEKQVRSSLRAANALRTIKHEVLPRLKKINDEKKS